MYTCILYIDMCSDEGALATRRSRQIVASDAAICLYGYIHACIHTYIHACMHACMHACIHANLCILCKQDITTIIAASSSLAPFPFLRSPSVAGSGAPGRGSRESSHAHPLGTG